MLTAWKKLPAWRVKDEKDEEDENEEDEHEEESDGALEQGARALVSLVGSSSPPNWRQPREEEKEEETEEEQEEEEEEKEESVGW